VPKNLQCSCWDSVSWSRQRAAVDLENKHHIHHAVSPSGKLGVCACVCVVLSVCACLYACTIVSLTVSSFIHARSNEYSIMYECVYVCMCHVF
jgi:hypothetical protein